MNRQVLLSFAVGDRGLGGCALEGRNKTWPVPGRPCLHHPCLAYPPHPAASTAAATTLIHRGPCRFLPFADFKPVPSWGAARVEHLTGVGRNMLRCSHTFWLPPQHHLLQRRRGPARFTLAWAATTPFAPLRGLPMAAQLTNPHATVALMGLRFPRPSLEGRGLRRAWSACPEPEPEIDLHGQSASKAAFPPGSSL
jgi:hypothetical protein